MTGRTFLDTNVLVYAIDDADSTKKKTARILLTETANVVLSAQVLNEFYVTITRKLKPAVAPEIATQLVLSHWDDHRLPPIGPPTYRPPVLCAVGAAYLATCVAFVAFFDGDNAGSLFLRDRDAHRRDVAGHDHHVVVGDLQDAARGRRPCSRYRSTRASSSRGSRTAASRFPVGYHCANSRLAP